MSTIHRKRKGHLTYVTHRRSNDADHECAFCTISPKSKQVLKNHTYFREITNIFPYSLWDSSKVTEHAMLVPKRHITSLSQLTKPEKLEYITLISEKEGQGYDVFSRGHNSHMKSVPHQHTHILKTTGKRIKTLVYHAKPLITWHRY